MTKHTTSMRNCRPWPTEFAHGCEVGDTEARREAITHPPWYVVHVRGKFWSQKGWYDWIDYLGPPKVFLTRRRAEEHAREIRKQYGSREEYGYGPLRVRVMSISPTEGS